MNLKKLKQGCVIGLAAIILSSLAAPVQTEAATWKKNNVGWWWQEDNGSYPANAWKTINGRNYYFDQRGYMKSGWHWDGSNWYYLGGANDGAMKTGWQKVNGKWYFMNSDGKMAVGWKTIGGKKYFLESSGAMHSGWLWDGSNWYWLGGANDGAMKTGWQKVNGVWYYMYQDGKMAANTWIGTYYVNGSGAWTKTKEPAKWIKSGSRWWYRHEDGGYTTNGFETIGGKKYYFDGAGWMVTGWRKISNQWYYFDGSGAMATSRWIGDYYVGSNGVMATNTWIGNYYVGGDGKWVNDTKASKQAQALKIAKQIAADIPTDLSDLERVKRAAATVSRYCGTATYTMSGENYNTAYGVFIAKEYSCAGATRALGMVLECMGYSWTHINENQMTHQWCELKMDGQTGYADGMAGFAYYGEYPKSGEIIPSDAFVNGTGGDSGIIFIQ